NQRQPRLQELQRLQSVASHAKAELNDMNAAMGAAAAEVKVAMLESALAPVERARTTIRELFLKAGTTLEIFPVSGLDSEQSRLAQYEEAYRATIESHTRLVTSLAATRSLSIAARILKSANTFYAGGDLAARFARFAAEAGLLANMHVQRAVALVPSILTDALSDNEAETYNYEALLANVPYSGFASRNDPFAMYILSATDHLAKLRSDTLRPAFKLAALVAAEAAVELHRVRVDFLLDQLHRRDGEPLLPTSLFAARQSRVLGPLDDATLAALDDAGASHPADAVLPVDPSAVSRGASHIDAAVVDGANAAAKAAKAAPSGPPRYTAAEAAAAAAEAAEAAWSNGGPSRLINPAPGPLPLKPPPPVIPPPPLPDLDSLLALMLVDLPAATATATAASATTAFTQTNAGVRAPAPLPPPRLSSVLVSSAAPAVPGAPPSYV
ncbi:hypothetical protein HK405_011437, partial [Cladochytrium tenue]